MGRGGRLDQERRRRLPACVLTKDHPLLRVERSDHRLHSDLFNQVAGDRDHIVASRDASDLELRRPTLDSGARDAARRLFPANLPPRFSNGSSAEATLVSYSVLNGPKQSVRMPIRNASGFVPPQPAPSHRLQRR